MCTLGVCEPPRINLRTSNSILPTGCLAYDSIRQHTLAYVSNTCAAILLTYTLTGSSCRFRRHYKFTDKCNCVVRSRYHNMWHCTCIRCKFFDSAVASTCNECKYATTSPALAMNANSEMCNELNASNPLTQKLAKRETEQDTVRTLRNLLNLISRRDDSLDADCSRSEHSCTLNRLSVIFPD